MATQELFPGVQVTIGPVIEDGFFYDFATGHNFTPEDLEKIEQRMEELVADDLPVERMVYQPRESDRDVSQYGRALQGADHRGPARG